MPLRIDFSTKPLPEADLASLETVLRAHTLLRAIHSGTMSAVVAPVWDFQLFAGPADAAAPEVLVLLAWLRARPEVVATTVRAAVVPPVVQ